MDLLLGDLRLYRPQQLRGALECLLGQVLREHGPSHGLPLSEAVLDINCAGFKVHL
jgi:hypothetical protein